MIYIQKNKEVHYYEQKKNNKKIDQRMYGLLDENYEAAKKEVSNFYEDHTLVIPRRGNIAKTMADIQKKLTDQTSTEEQVLEKCPKIRENVKKGEPNNIEIDFIHGKQKFEGRELPLGETVFKAVEFTSRTPIYFYRGKDDVTDAFVFIGGEDARAFMIARDNNGNISFIRLAELHMLSISENSKPEKEIGLMTSYIWSTAKIYSSIIFSLNLYPVKNLLMAEAINAKSVENEERTGLEEEDTDEGKD